MLTHVAMVCLFWFVLLGSKLVLGVVVLHMLLPGDLRCSVCDADLIALESPRRLRFLMRVVKVQRFWCIECNRQSLGHTRALASGTRHGPPLPVAELRSR